MIKTVLVLSAVCAISSGSVGHVATIAAPVAHIAPAAPPPIVTAASSQYFERTFNRLVAAQPVFEPVIPVAQAPAVVPVAQAPPVFQVAHSRPVFHVAPAPPVQPVTKTVTTVPVPPTQNVPVDPNIAIAVATAHAAAPIATILLPPYPFAPPHTIGFIPAAPPINVPDEEKKEFTTPSTTTSVTQSTPSEPEPTTPLPLPSNTANSFAQALPSNQNVNYNQVYGPPLPPQSARPQKLKTSVEVVPVPLEYISPPPVLAHLHHHHHGHHHGHYGHYHGHSHAHIHTFVPRGSKLIIRPVKLRTVRVPAKLVAHRRPLPARNIARSDTAMARDTEPTTFSPFNRPNTKPPRV